MPIWNPWHGCHKISPGCKHCYVFREDVAFGCTQPTDNVRKTASFRLPVKRDRKRNWKYPAGSEFALCFTSDFLIPEADEWRQEIWEIIKTRNDCTFYFFTKRIERLKDCLPDDWGSGYDNVGIGCTVENQNRADFRLPIFLDLPIKHRMIIVAPMLERIDLSKYLNRHLVSEVSIGGESGKYARPLDFNWVKGLREQCVGAMIPFNFHQTGTYLIKDCKRYVIPRRFQHEQARKANMNFYPTD